MQAIKAEEIEVEMSAGPDIVSISVSQPDAPTKSAHDEEDELESAPRGMRAASGASESSTPVRNRVISDACGSGSGSGDGDGLIRTRLMRAPSFYPVSLGGMGPEMNGMFIPSRQLRSNSLTDEGGRSERVASFSADVPINAPVILVWKDLTVSTKTNPPKVSTRPCCILSYTRPCLDITRCKFANSPSLTTSPTLHEPRSS